jgi:hypothetical protein
MNGGGSDPSAALRQQQQQNQQRVQQGLSQINSIFGGGSYGTNPAATYAPGTNYFTLSGQPFKFDLTDSDVVKWAKQNKIALTPQVPRTVSGVATGKAPAALSSQQITKIQAQYGQHLAKTGGLFTGTATSKGFTDQFYQDRVNAQEAVQLPQLGQQFQQQQKGLAYNLADRGLLRSSAATDLGQSLKDEYTSQAQDVSQNAQAGANALRQNVEQQRQSLVNQLETSSDPAATTQLALGATAGLSAPSTFAPLGNAFQNWSNLYLANNLPLASQYGQQMYNPYMMFAGLNNPLGGQSYRITQ